MLRGNRSYHSSARLRATGRHKTTGTLPKHVHLVLDSLGFRNQRRQLRLIEPIAALRVGDQAGEQHLPACQNAIRHVAQGSELRIRCECRCAKCVTALSQKYDRLMPLRLLGQLRAMEQFEQRGALGTSGRGNLMASLDIT